MTVRSSFHALFHLIVCFLLALLTACGGGGGTGGSVIPVPVVPPSGLVYATNPAVYTLGQAIPANTPSHGGGPVDAYAVTPSLPAGLSMNSTSGAITGTPMVIAASSIYTVRASNGGGSTTAALNLSVTEVPPTNLAYSTPTATYTLGSAIVPNTPTHAGGGNLHYAVTPALPAGLVLDSVSGVISGTPTVLAATATYTITAANSGGSTTVNLSITVNDPPSIAPSFTTQPLPQSVTAPAGATFTVAVSGTPTPSLQWQRSTDGGVTWVDLTGATSASYTTPATTGTDNGAQFRVVATNPAGSLASTAATLMVVSLGKVWGAAERIGPASGGIYEPPQIRFDGQGNAMAVWIQEVIGVAQRDLWANRYIAGTGWGTPQIIVPGVGARMGRVQLGMSADGKALAVWEVMDVPYAPMAHIWSISYEPGMGWGTATGIDNDTYPFQSGSPKLAVAANGAAVAVWGQGDGLTLTNIVMVAGSTGSGWGTPSVLVTAPISQGAGGAEVALGALGHGAVIWQQSNGSVFTVRGAPISGGTAGTPQVISANTGALVNPHVATNASGTAVAVWGQLNGSRFEITSNRFVPGTGWGSPAQVNNPGYPIFNQTPDPLSHLDDAGTATVLWVEGTGASYPKFWNHQTALGWGSAELITYSLGTYRLVGNSAGQLLGARFNGQNLYASPAYLSTAADWGAGTLLTSTGYIPLEMAMDSGGNSLAVWIEPVAGGYALMGSLYR